MKIAHLSDLHLSSEYRPKNLFYTHKLIEYALDQKADHLAITGDLTHNSTSQDFDDLRQLLKKLGILNSPQVSLVIGNHDIFGGVHLAEDLLTFPDQAEKTDYQQKLHEFRYYFQETFDNNYQPQSGNIFPYAKIIENVAFIGVNSIAKYSKIKNLFASRGKLDKFQMQGLKKIFSHPDVRNKSKIVLIHHHFAVAERKAKPTLLENLESHSMKLAKRKKIQHFFKKNEVKLVLHGHAHESNQYLKKGIRYLNAGGSIESDHLDYLHFNFINIQDEQVEVEIRKIPKKKFQSKKYINNHYAYST